MPTNAPTTPAKDRPVFTLELRAEPGVDPVLALRALIKIALRRYGLKCVAAHEGPTSKAATKETSHDHA